MPWIEPAVIAAPTYIMPESALEEAQEAQDNSNCLVERVAYDIGSHATKVMAATVDVCRKTVKNVYSLQNYPVHYRHDLIQSLNNEFSENIQRMGLKALKNAKTSAEVDYYLSPKQSDQDLQHCAVATAAFREANNGEYYLQQLSTSLNMPIEVISQEEEGKLAYYGALSLAGDQFNLQSPIVWDIGGGSMQVTYKDEQDDLQVMGAELAANNFHNLVLEKLRNSDNDDFLYPMSAAEVNEAILLAKAYLTFDEQHMGYISHQIAEGSPILAVGGVHNQVVQPLCKAIAQCPEQNYTRADLINTIKSLTNKTYPEITAMLVDNNQHIKNQLTNLILVYATMDILGIDKVHTLPSSNVQGILLKGC